MEELAPVTAQPVVIQSKNVDENDPFGQWRAREGRIKPLADATGGASTKRGSAMRGLLDRSDDRMNRAIKSDPSELRGRLQTSKATADQLLTRKENIERTYVPQAKRTGGTGNTSLPEAWDKQSQINGSSLARLARGGNGVLSSYSEAPDANSNVAVDLVDYVPSPKVTQKKTSKAGTKRPREDQASTSPSKKLRLVVRSVDRSYSERRPASIDRQTSTAMQQSHSETPIHRPAIARPTQSPGPPTPALGPAVLVQKQILSSEQDHAELDSPLRPTQSSEPPIAALGLSKRVESVLGKYLEELRGDSEHWNRVLLKRSRLSLASRLAEAAAPGSAHEKTEKPYSGKPYSFAKLKPLKMTKVPAGSPPGKATKFQVQPMSSAGNGTKIAFACPVVAIDVQTDMPSYAHYVEIKDNFLAPNVRAMQAWPYFNDEFDYTKDGAGLKEFFSLDVDERSKKLLRLAQAQNIEGYAESALQDLAITWADVLRFLFAGEEDLNVGKDKDALQALAHRQQSCDEEFTRKAERTAIVLSSLAPSTPQKLAMAAALCENFLKMTKFSLWHVARRHMYDAVERKDIEHAVDLELLTCGICLRLDCPYHGTLKEHEEDDEDEETEPQPAALMDIVHPPNINFRTRTALARTAEVAVEPSKLVSKRTLQYWQKLEHQSEEREPFRPCNHPGTPCEDALCSCFTEKFTCEKTCACSLDCLRRFQGCTCRHDKPRKNQSMMCFEDERCFCFKLNRECDPDLCGTCGVGDVLNPLYRFDPVMQMGRCQHASIQRGVTKRTVIGDSRIHGLGLYAGENVKECEFVGEYKGELIDTAESDRRGAVYEHQKLSYLFSVNKSQEIDSTYFGTKIRFINHAITSVSNLSPRVFLVNTVQRIALFASEEIKIGDELFFDYGPQFPRDQLGGKITGSTKSVPRTHRPNAVEEEFYEVARVKDAQGNTRATKAVRKGRPGKTVTKRTGPPTGADSRPSRKSAHLEKEEDLKDELGADPSIVPSTAARLSAYNISDSGPGVSGTMSVEAAAGAEDESDGFEPGVSAEEESEDDGVEGTESEQDEPAKPRRHRNGKLVRVGGKLGGVRR
ncbi:hypothetical protein LTR75_012819 [Friedmanniomyces endolithicus]|nr:hypothetical protein LTR75_012819 [Friedmanniomyces endolithicus]